MNSPTARAIPPQALDLIRQAEGCRLEAYPDQASALGKRVRAMGLKSYTGWKLWQTLPGDPWTIGFGHTEGVHPGMQISQTTADRMLESELYVVYEPGVLHACSVPLNDNEFSALLSFAYNEGVHALNTSTLMKKLNAEDRIGAASEFPNWTKAGGQVLPGLVARRHREAALFLTPMSTPA